VTDFINQDLAGSVFEDVHLTDAGLIRHLSAPVS
jgi:hypothetical protein